MHRQEPRDFNSFLQDIKLLTRHQTTIALTISSLPRLSIPSVVSAVWCLISSLKSDAVSLLFLWKYPEILMQNFCHVSFYMYFILWVPNNRYVTPDVFSAVKIYTDFLAHYHISSGIHLPDYNSVIPTWSQHDYASTVEIRWQRRMVLTSELRGIQMKMGDNNTAV